MKMRKQNRMYYTQKNVFFCLFGFAKRFSGSVKVECITLDVQQIFFIENNVTNWHLDHDQSRTTLDSNSVELKKKQIFLCYKVMCG